MSKPAAEFVRPPYAGRMQTPLASHHLLAKPAGAACNLGCKYCFFLSKQNLYGERESPLMDEATLDTCLRQSGTK
jgi:uncharacterized protein